MAIFCKPFSIETSQSPGTLSLAVPTGGEPLSVDTPPDAHPPEEVILERDGIHYINSRFMNPGAETEKNLDKKFLDLVDSVINPEGPGAPWN